jgi:hypothetical protein
MVSVERSSSKDRPAVLRETWLSAKYGPSIGSGATIVTRSSPLDCAAAPARPSL